MRLRLLLSTLTLAAVLGPRPATAQTPSAPPAARPAALERLAPLVGRWTMASLPPGVTLVETCEWFVGEQQVVCQMRSRSAAWQRGALTVFGYDAADSSYSMTAFGSGGQQLVARGRAWGDTLVFEGELRQGTGLKRARVTIIPRPDGFELLDQEADPTGSQGPWKPPARIRYVPAPTR
jgi:hypothetical protein